VIELKPQYEELISFEDEDIYLSVTLQDLLEQLNEDEKSIIILRVLPGVFIERNFGITIYTFRDHYSVQRKI
jgi:hypothetical protein